MTTKESGTEGAVRSAPRYVYLLRCSDGSLYCGTAVDAQRRLAKHNAGNGAKYTRGRRPCVLVYSEGPY